jgi:predicted acetyltransferase
MPGSTSLRLITTPQQRRVTERLWQLYHHDLSEFRGSMPDSEGLYKPGRLPTFFEDPDRCGYLIYSDQALAGFALIRGLTEEQKVVGEFFVVRAIRRQRVGYEAAMTLLRLHPGRWAIPFQEENQGAARFWRRVAADVARAACEEEERPVPGKPGIPPDTWLLLSTRLPSFRSDCLILADVRSRDGPLSVRRAPPASRAPEDPFKPLRRKHLQDPPLSAEPSRSTGNTAERAGGSSNSRYPRPG